jgi:hypothetical protein
MAVMMQTQTAECNRFRRDFRVLFSGLATHEGA